MTLTLVVTQEEANVIVNALANMPYGVVHELMPKLEAQFKAQMASPPTNGVTDHNALS
jgi:hypothetical protein